MAAAKKKTAKKPTVKKTVAKKTSSTVKKSSAKKSELNLVNTPVTSKQTQAQIIADLADATALDKKSVRNLFEALLNQIERHMKPRGSGEMTLPGLGIKVRRVSKKATKARQGVNPFTGEAMTIKAKPARKAVRAVALKSLKDLA
jgi:nucleoid DNA-binding protein